MFYMLKLISIIICGFVLGHYFLYSRLFLNLYCSKGNSRSPVFIFWIPESNGMHNHIYFAMLGFIAETLGIHLRVSIIKPKSRAPKQHGSEKDIFSLRFYITVHHQMRQYRNSQQKPHGRNKSASWLAQRTTSPTVGWGL